MAVVVAGKEEIMVDESGAVVMVLSVVRDAVVASVVLMVVSVPWRVVWDSSEEVVSVVVSVP